MYLKMWFLLIIINQLVHIEEAVVVQSGNTLPSQQKVANSFPGWLHIWVFSLMCWFNLITASEFEYLDFLVEDPTSIAAQGSQGWKVLAVTRTYNMRICAVLNYGIRLFYSNGTSKDVVDTTMFLPLWYFSVGWYQFYEETFCIYVYGIPKYLLFNCLTLILFI